MVEQETTGLHYQDCCFLQFPDGSLSFHFMNEDVHILIKNISPNGKFRSLHGDVTVEYPPQTPRVSNAIVSLTGADDRRRFIYDLDKLVLDTGTYYLPWSIIINYAFAKAIEYYRRGPDITVVSSAEEKQPIRFDIEPLLLSDLPTTIYSDGGAGKSLTALLAAVVLRLPWYDNPLGLKVEQSEVANNVVWLDWETSRNVFQRRLSNLVDGMNLGAIDISYIYCENTLSNQGEDFFNEINILNPRLTIVDSIGAACAGDLNGSEAPTNFFNALRKIAGTKLLLFHTNKDKELYGNRFFWNFTRAAFELKSETDGNKLTVGLFHTKHNETPQYEPFSFEFEFDNEADTITVCKGDLTAVPELEKNLPLRKRIRELIKAQPSGKLPAEDIATILDSPLQSISTTLYRNKNWFTKIDGEWGILAP